MEIGKVTHIYGKIGVAIVELKAGLKSGDKIEIKKDDEVIAEQTVDSMQIEKKPVEVAKKGDTIGLKVEGQVREGMIVYKVK